MVTWSRWPSPRGPIGSNVVGGEVASWLPGSMPTAATFGRESSRSRLINQIVGSASRVSTASTSRRPLSRSSSFMVGGVRRSGGRQAGNRSPGGLRRGKPYPIGGHPVDLGQPGADRRYPGRLVGATAVGHRGEVGAVGLDQHAVERARAGGGLHISGALERDDPGEAEEGPGRQRPGR